MLTLFRSAAILLGLTSMFPFCRAQESTGYGLPDSVLPPPSAPRLVQRTYLVADLVVPVHKGLEKQGRPLHETLMSLLKNTIEPETWEGLGGRGTLDYF